MASAKVERRLAVCTATREGPSAKLALYRDEFTVAELEHLAFFIKQAVDILRGKPGPIMRDTECIVYADQPWFVTPAVDGA